MKALVYIDAFVPDEGETVLQILGGSGSAPDVPDPTTVLDLAAYRGGPDGDLEAFLKAPTGHDSFAQDLGPGHPPGHTTTHGRAGRHDPARHRGQTGQVGSWSEPARSRSTRRGVGQRTSCAHPRTSKILMRRADASIWPRSTPWRAHVGSAW